MAQAAEVISILAPDGLVILKMPYPTQWTHMHTRLAEIESRGLEATLRALTGDLFVDELNASFADYGRVLGVTKAAAPEAPAADLGELRRAVAQRVTEYAIQVLATVDAEKAATVKRAQTALAPIQDVRASARRASPSTDEVVTPVEAAPAPTPVVVHTVVTAPRPSVAPLAN